MPLRSYSFGEAMDFIGRNTCDIQFVTIERKNIMNPTKVTGEMKFTLNFQEISR